MTARLDTTLLCCALALAFASSCADMEDTPDPQNNTSSTTTPTDTTPADADMSADMDASGEDMGEEDMGEEGDLLVLPEKPWDITTHGPYGIGYTTDEFTYQARPDGRSRTLRVALWYPTREKSGIVARYLGLLPRINIFGEMGQRVIVDASISGEGPYPVLIFSHGNGSLAEQSYFMTEFFTSHGWVVLAVDHTNNTFADNGGSINLESSLDRPQDISALIDWVEDLGEDHILFGQTTDDIVLSGHSFGGFTTLANAGITFAIDDVLAECTSGSIDRDVCETFTNEETLQVFREGFGDERIKVAIPQTPGIGAVFGDGAKDITIPTLVLTGAKDITLPNVEDGDPIWEGFTGGNNLRVDFKEGGHFTFSNMCELFGNAVDQVGDDGCNEDFIPFDEAFPIINHYSMAFARFHLFGDMSDMGLITGTDQPYSADVDVEVK